MISCGGNVRRQTNWTFPEGVFRADSNFAIIHFK